MAKQTTKPVAKKAVATISSSKPKISKKIAMTSVKNQDAKKPLVKSAKTSTKAATASPKKSTVPVVKKAGTPVAKEKSTAGRTPKTPAIKKSAAKPSHEERYRMVEVTAYFIAEQNGFMGRPDEYWVAAEQEVAARLNP